MTQELRVLNQVRLIDNGSAIRMLGRDELVIAKTGDSGPSPGMINLTTTMSVIDYTPGIAIGNCGWVWLRNLGPDTVFWGTRVSTTFYPVGELRIGESASFRLKTDISSAFTAKAETTTAQLEALVWED